MKKAVIYENLYEYDIKSCFYNILKNINYKNLHKISDENKLKRNISIGLLQKNNPILSNYLHTMSKNLIDIYITENNLTDNDIILRNKDGIITKSLLNSINIGLELSYRGFILKAIRGIDGNFLLYYDDFTIRIMGRKNFINEKYFKKLINIPCKNNLEYLYKINEIRNEILNIETDIECFIMDGKNDTIIIPSKNGDFMNMSKSFSEKISINSIDRSYLWKQLYNFVLV